MLTILINSYTCCPNMGSEQGMGWNWIIHLAKHCELFVISEGEYKEQCEAASKGLPIHWYWNPVPQSTRDKCWNQGDWRFYYYYSKWQKRTAEIALEICKKEHIDVLHQLNMIGFREPGFLANVSRETGIPLVWGPVDAKDKFPLAYADGAGLKTKAFLWLKNIITVWQLKHDKRVNETARQASVLLGASSNSVASFKKYLGVESILMNETGCHISGSDYLPHQMESVSHCSTFNILWIGKMDFRKQLGLALRAFAQAHHADMRLHVLGNDGNTTYKTMAKKLGIEEMVIWHGAIPHSEVQRLMKECQLLLFTSVAEGTPHVVLEAIANALPVVCHDTCGHGDSVTPNIGIKVAVETPGKSVLDFASAMECLYQDRSLLAQMSANCHQRALELSWKRKAEKMLELYNRIIIN